MGDVTDGDLSADDLYDRMEVLDPYTTGALVSTLAALRAQVRTLLERLATSARVRKKAPDPERAVWIRTPPTHDCEDCGYSYEGTFLHPVLSTVQFCPQCGAQVES